MSTTTEKFSIGPQTWHQAVDMSLWIYAEGAKGNCTPEGTKMAHAEIMECADIADTVPGLVEALLTFRCHFMAISTVNEGLGQEAQTSLLDPSQAIAAINTALAPLRDDLRDTEADAGEPCEDEDNQSAETAAQDLESAPIGPRGYPVDEHGLDILPETGFDCDTPKYGDDMTSKDITLGGWLVETTLDDDGHLTVWVTHADDSGADPIGIDDGRAENGWSERFTTRQIEGDYDRDHPPAVRPADDPG